MHVAKDDVLKYLELFAQGFTKERVAKEFNLKPHQLNQRLNKYNFKVLNIYDMVNNGMSAQEMYESVWPRQPEREEPAAIESPESSLPLLLNQISHKLSVIIDQNTSHNNMLAELLSMKRAASSRGKPGEDKDSSRTERYKNMAGKRWSKEEDDLIIEEFERDPNGYASRLEEVLGRKRQAISCRKWLLVNEGKIPAARA